MEIWKAIVKRKVRMIEHNLRYPGIISFMPKGIIEEKIKQENQDRTMRRK